MKKIWLFPFLALSFALQLPAQSIRTRVNLGGRWQFAMDPANNGIREKWFLIDLADSINLPGTMDERHKGNRRYDTTTMHLNRLYEYTGAAWYRRKISIPQDFKAKKIHLILERTKSTQVWIDGRFIGSSRLLQSPQQFDLPFNLTPGEHFIAIRVDNSLNLTPYGNVHIYSDDTQTNWNGILGEFYLEASSPAFISDLQAYPDIDAKKVNVRLNMENLPAGGNIAIHVDVMKDFQGRSEKLEELELSKPGEPVVNFEYTFGNTCELWDEYQRPLYRITVTITGRNIKDSKTVAFGMRKFSVQGTQFSINGHAIFLRGKHDACVFPLTGHPPMDADGWIRVYKIAKSYGINHYRFHSWCPPEAAFAAADREGIYLQAELPFWGGLDSDSIAAMLNEEGMAMLKAYGNHPSFVMFSHGNELWSGLDRVEKNINAFRAADNRHLYAMGSNNNIGYVGPPAWVDFFVAGRTPYAHDTVLTHTRLTHAFVDSRDGGLLNTQTPSTEVNFDYAVSKLHVPIVGHETGQYQIFPYYKEIDKYTGVLRAWNLEVFKNRLVKAGMYDQDMDFHTASGAWAALCYKAEMEAAVRTRGFGGFQLLDLQDFPGQGTALVGILDAFMDSKGVITPESWKQSCNDVTLLAEFPKYAWKNSERFTSRIVIANYSNQVLNRDVKWDIRHSYGDIIKKGIFENRSLKIGLTDMDEISIDLNEVSQAEKLMLNISIPGSPWSNEYPLWVYPDAPDAPDTTGIIVAHELTGDILTCLQKGGKVLFMPSAEEVSGKTVNGLFPPDFWNYGMFKGISESNNKPVSPGTLGILVNPSHPIFSLFPTDFHTNWQWFSIIKAGHPFILDETPASYRPVVQVIDNLERNHKLGLIFEFSVGKGKLLLCMAELDKLLDKPEAAQLYRSILRYMHSEDFNPSFIYRTNPSVQPF